jgi:signal transduction histidine kinase
MSRWRAVTRWFRTQPETDSVLASLMSQTSDVMVCFDFQTPVDPAGPGDQINKRLRDAVIVEASTPFARSFGFEKREDVIGQHMMDLFRNRVPDWFVRYGTEVENEQFKNLERVVQVPLPGGRTVPLRIHMQNIFDGDLLVRQWVTIRDVSDQERSKQALIESERIKSIALEAANLRTFKLDFEPLSAGIDPGGPEQQESDPELLQTWAREIDTADLERIRAQLRAVRSGALETVHALFRMQTGTRPPRSMEMWGRAMEHDESGRARGVTGVFVDRTELRNLESRMRTAQKLETLGVLAGGIAHDFNNLLMAIMGSAELARESDDASADLDQVEAAAQRASELCNQLLTYAGKATPALTSIDLSNVVEEMTELLRLSVDRNARLEFQIEGPTWVRGDAAQIGQVAMNLVKNASDALEGRDDPITITVGHCTYEPSWQATHRAGAELSPGEYGYLEVSDPGTGMSAEELEKLFDPFFTTKFSGHGLGMAVVLGIVHGHHGGVLVDSQPGDGTSVRVVIPQVAAPHEVETRAAALPERRIAGRVLLVDDEPGVRQVVSKMLEVLGADSASAVGGAEAIALMEQSGGAFEAVLMDVSMPGMDGISAAREILRAFPKTKVVLSSGLTNQSVPDDLRGRVGFVQKPYRLNELSEALDSTRRG